MLRQAQQPAQGPKRNARPETARALTPAYYIVQPSVEGWLSEMFYTTQDLLYARPAYYWSTTRYTGNFITDTWVKRPYNSENKGWLHYSFHKGSFCHPEGNPIADVSMLGNLANKQHNSYLNEFVESIAFNQYCKQHKIAYSLLADVFMVIQSELKWFGSCGITAITRFHTRLWCAQAFLSTFIDFIQLSRISCCGTPYDLAILFLILLSVKLKYNFVK